MDQWGDRRTTMDGGEFVFGFDIVGISPGGFPPGLPQVYTPWTLPRFGGVSPNAFGPGPVRPDSNVRIASGLRLSLNIRGDGCPPLCDLTQTDRRPDARKARRTMPFGPHCCRRIRSMPATTLNTGASTHSMGIGRRFPYQPGAI